MLLTTILLNFYRVLGETGEDISSGQDGILASTIASSYIEKAAGLAYDEKTFQASIRNATDLTNPIALGPDLGEHNVNDFNDVDDFNMCEVNDSLYNGPAKADSLLTRVFRVRMDVCYVNPGDMATASASTQWTKRVDVKIWRVFPPPTSSSRLDTLKMSQVVGYFKFN